jgi:hypothetical protein
MQAQAAEFSGYAGNSAALKRRVLKQFVLIHLFLNKSYLARNERVDAYGMACEICGLVTRR